MRYIKILLCIITLYCYPSNSYCQSWESLGPFGGTFSEIAISESNPDYVYAGTYYGGVYKSNDGGENWQHAGLTGSYIINKICIDPDDPLKVFVSYRIVDPYYTGSETVRSVDGGKSWSPNLISSLENRLLIRMFISSSVVFFSVWIRQSWINSSPL